MLEHRGQLLISLERYNFCLFSHNNSSVILCNTKEALVSIGSGLEEIHLLRRGGNPQHLSYREDRIQLQMVEVGYVLDIGVEQLGY